MRLGVPASTGWKIVLFDLLLVMQAGKSSPAKKETGKKETGKGKTAAGKTAAAAKGGKRKAKA